MGEKNKYFNYTSILGDTYPEQLVSEETEDSDPVFKSERDFKLAFGYVKEATIKYGFELGTSGATSILGYKGKNIGLMTWGTLSLFGIDGGIALMQAKKWNENFMTGISEYVSRNGVNRWSTNSYDLFKSYGINDEYNEVGLGAYSSISFLDLTIEGRIGKEIGTSSWRYYVTAGFYWE